MHATRVVGARWARLRRLLVSRRMQMAVKGALAAALAFVLAEAVTRALPGNDIEDYLFYAPFGAAFATDVTIAGSYRIARDSAVALVVGALLGLGVERYGGEPGPLQLALVVGLGVILGALPGVGGQRGLVPVVALFVLLIGHDTDTESYATGYVLLTALGAACGVLVNLLMPTMPFRQQQEAMDLLKQQIAGQLIDLADGLRARPAPEPSGWAKRRRDTRGTVADTREAVRQLLDAQRGNVLAAAGRQRDRVLLQAERLTILDRVAFLVDDLLVLLAQTHRGDLPSSPLDPHLAGLVADALDELAELVLVFDSRIDVDDERVRDAERSIALLTEEFGRRRDLAPDDVALLGAVVANLRRCTAAVHPQGPTISR